jgi:SAM-dependent methyltransferase
MFETEARGGFGENALDRLIAGTLHLRGEMISGKIKKHALGEAIANLAKDAQQLFDASRRIDGGTFYIDYLVDHFKVGLAHCGIKNGKILEISGAWVRYFENDLPEHEYNYIEIFPKEGDGAVILNDAINLSSIPDDYYDAVVSASVFEHINKPWLAAEEIKRVLRPGGMTMHFVPFSFPFHGSPYDFWRYTTSALESLFEGFTTISSEFYLPERRVNLIGTAHKRNEEEHPAFLQDAFGGWREASYTLYSGKKPLSLDKDIENRRENELALAAIYAVFDAGIGGWEAMVIAEELLRHVHLDREGRLHSSEPERSEIFEPSKLKAADIWHIWDKAQKSNSFPTHIRYLLRNYLHLVPTLAGTALAKNLNVKQRASKS